MMSRALMREDMPRDVMPTRVYDMRIVHVIKRETFDNIVTQRYATTAQHVYIGICEAGMRTCDTLRLRRWREMRAL